MWISPQDHSHSATPKMLSAFASARFVEPATLAFTPPAEHLMAALTIILWSAQ
jgi:hypothetical protein